jgi:uncharacterized protein GlcG (DUF336 family)
VITLSDARRVIAAAEKKAQEIGQPMNVAVADAGGNLVAHVRMDKAWLGSIDISIKKAYTSRLRGRYSAEKERRGSRRDRRQRRLGRTGPRGGRSGRGSVLAGR